MYQEKPREKEVRYLMRFLSENTTEKEALDFTLSLVEEVFKPIECPKIKGSLCELKEYISNGCGDIEKISHEIKGILSEKIDLKTKEYQELGPQNGVRTKAIVEEICVYAIHSLALATRNFKGLFWRHISHVIDDVIAYEAPGFNIHDSFGNAFPNYKPFPPKGTAMSFANLDLPFIEEWLLNNSSREDAIRLACKLTIGCSAWCKCDELNTAIINVTNVLMGKEDSSLSLSLSLLVRDKAHIRVSSRKMFSSSYIKDKATYELLLARMVRELYEISNTKGVNADFWVKIMECIEYSMDIDGFVDIHNVMRDVYPTYTKPGIYDRVASAIKYFYHGSIWC